MQRNDCAGEFSTVHVCSNHSNVGVMHLGLLAGRPGHHRMLHSRDHRRDDGEEVVPHVRCQFTRFLWFGLLGLPATMFDSR